MTDYIHVSAGGEVSFIPGELNVPRKKVDEMSEYIVTCDEETASWIGNDADSMRLLVRCRDCRHVVHIPDWQPDKRFKPIDLWVCEAEWCMGFEGDHPDVTPDGFCCWGEPREGEESC